MILAFQCEQCEKFERAAKKDAPSPFSLTPTTVPSVPAGWFVLAKGDELTEPGMSPALLCSTDCVMRYVSRDVPVPEEPA